MDPHDVSWVDSEIADNEGDARVCVKDNTSKPKKQHRPALGQVDLDSNLEVFIFSGWISTISKKSLFSLISAPNEPTRRNKIGRDFFRGPRVRTKTEIRGLVA
jgi:hypothetical protein